MQQIKHNKLTFGADLCTL